MSTLYSSYSKFRVATKNIDDIKKFVKENFKIWKRDDERKLVFNAFNEMENAAEYSKSDDIYPYCIPRLYKNELKLKRSDDFYYIDFVVSIWMHWWPEKEDYEYLGKDFITKTTKENLNVILHSKMYDENMSKPEEPLWSVNQIWGNNASEVAKQLFNKQYVYEICEDIGYLNEFKEEYKNYEQKYWINEMNEIVLKLKNEGVEQFSLDKKKEYWSEIEEISTNLSNLNIRASKDFLHLIKIIELYPEEEYDQESIYKTEKYEFEEYQLD